VTLADQVWSEDDRRKLREAFDTVYTTIERGKELIREGLDGPLTMACQFQEVQAKVDEVEKLVDGLALSLQEVGQMAEILHTERDKAQQEMVLAAAKAYAQGWPDRLAALIEVVPEQNADLVARLSEAFEGNRRADHEIVAVVLTALKGFLQAIKREQIDSRQSRHI